MPKAARVRDLHLCTALTPLPHLGGPIKSPASPNVETNRRGAARTADELTCIVPSITNFIVTGSATVEINGKLASRQWDKTMHPGPGVILTGSSNVDIGGGTAGGTLGEPKTAAAQCRAAANGRTSGSTSQSYNNCGVESSRQLINRNGNPIDEDTLLDDALRSGDAETKPTRFDSGGTGPDGRERILDSHGVPSHQVPQGMNNIAQNVAEGRGVITSHDAGILWDDSRYNGGGHAIVPTGLEYDKNGRLKNVIVNDTGQGQCGQKIPADRFESSLRPGRNVNVTDDPIWRGP